MAFVPTIELHENTIPGLLRRNAEWFPDNDCIVAPEFAVRWSWKEFDRRTTMVARGMYAMGIRKGDHVAIWAYGTGLVKDLILHLPAPFENGRFQGPSMGAGQTCNYYHKLFSEAMGFNSLDHIRQALEMNTSWKSSYESAGPGYGAFAARNRKVADTCTHMVAFTFADGDVPADGGTKMAWDMAADKLCIHVPLGAA